MIYTFNTRNNIIWQLVRNHFNTTAVDFNIEVNYHFQEFLRYLERKNLDYRKLNKALIPNRDKDKRELLLCFDTNKDSAINSYDEHILTVIFPLLNNTTVHSIHIGDFICPREYQNRVKELLSKNLRYVKNSVWMDSSQYFFIYINNVTRDEKKNVLENLYNEKTYIGYCDFTYENELKDLLAYTLSSVCIKKGNMIIFPSETADDHFHFFTKQGYKECPIIQEYYYSFLEYKIESSLLYHIDVSDSLNAICPFYINLSDVNVCVKPDKLKYLNNVKAKIMKRSGMNHFTIEDLQKLLKEKIRQNYIFNLHFDEWGNIRFNILFEIFCFDKRVKVMAAFKYIPDKSRIDLITLF